MYKQSSSRGHRSKGITGKHVLQLCVLLAVSFWLIYQVKHSHDKRKEFEAKGGKISEKIQSDGETQRLGRKDLPRVTTTDVEDVEDKDFEEEENKHSDDQPDREEDNVNKGDGNSELNEKEPEHDEKQFDELIDRDDNEGVSEKKHTENKDEGDELKDRYDTEGGSEEKHTENKDEGASQKNHDANQANKGGSEGNHVENEEGESEENNTENEEHEGGPEESHTEDEEKENGDKEDPTELEKNERDRKGDQDQNDTASEDQDHDGGRKSTHEAQEELYKADDASSEVAQNVQTIIPETNNSTTGQYNVLWGNVNFGHENETTTSNQGNAGEVPGENKVNSSGALSNATVTEEKKYEGDSAEPQNSSLHTSTLPSLPEGQPHNSSDSTFVDVQHPVFLLSNETQTVAASSNGTENINTNDGISSSSANTTTDSSQEMSGTDATLSGEDSSLHQGDKVENSSTAGSDEAFEDQSTNEGTGTLEHDPIDATDTELDALPEIIDDVQNTDGTMAE